MKVARDLTEKFQEKMMDKEAREAFGVFAFSKDACLVKERVR